MLKSLMLVSAIAIAAPALAQTTATPPSTNAAQPAASATPSAQEPTDTAQQPTAAATPAASAEAAQPADPAMPAAPAQQAANPSDAVAAVIAADWAKYDADSSGNLSKEEFAAWMTALREQNPAQKAEVADTANWTNAAFAQADKDKSGAVTKPELEGFLKGSA